MDPDALATANQLVGNPLDACGLEFTGMGPTLFFPQALCLAWTGGMMPATMTVANKANAIAVSLPSHRPVVVPAGATVRWGLVWLGFGVGSQWREELKPRHCSQADRVIWRP